MSEIQQIAAQLPMADIARRLGVDQATAEAAVQQALPTLVGGMAANAQDPAGEESLQHAVGQHSPSLVEGGISLDDVDTADGDKIVSHVFGPARGDVTQALAARRGVDQGLIEKLLPILAPIVLSLIAQRLSGRQGGQQGGLGSILGDLLGGAAGGAPRGGTSGGLGDLLGGLLGGGPSGQQSGGADLGGLLNDLLGQGRRSR